MPQSHQLGEGYSGRNPVPTVTGFREEHAKQQQATAAAAAAAMEGSTDSPLDVKPLPPPPETPTSIKPDPLTTQSPVDISSQAAPVTGTQGPAANGTPANGKPQDAKPPRSNEPKKETKEEVMAKANANKVKPTDRLKNNKAEHTVIDPVTGLEVIVKDAQYSS